MAAKKTLVELESKALGTQSFEFEHAERILQLPGSKWILPKNSSFEFVNNALYRKGNKRGVQRKQK